MDQSPERAERIESTEALRDLPPAPESEQVAGHDADAVRGGSKNQYMVYELEEVKITSVKT